jgi:dipeptidyl aminopeptidase/acylaminoacyl peptidase
MRGSKAVIAAIAASLTAGWVLPARADLPTIQQYLQIRSASGGVFGADGESVVFSTNITGTPQLWKVPSGGGWPEQLTFEDDKVTEVHRLPAGRGWIFLRDRGGDERTQLYWMSPDGKKIRALTRNPRAIHSLGACRSDGKAIAFASNARHPQFFDLYVMQIPSDRAVLLKGPREDGNLSARAFSPDGKTLVFADTLTPSNENLYVLDVVSGKSRLLTPHRGDATYGSVSFGRDGLLYALTDEGREFQSLARLRWQDPAARWEFLVPDRADCEDLVVTEAGDRLAYLVNRDGYSDLHIRETATGKDVLVKTLLEGVLSDLDWSVDGKRLAFTFSGPKDPADVWILEGTGAPRRLTRSALAGVTRDSFVTPAVIRYESFDRRQIPAYLYVPGKGAPAGPLPFVVYVHGGPESQERPDFAASFQYYLSRGYGLLALNIRGSTGYGRTYTHLDDTLRRRDAILDVDHAARYLTEHGLAHERRIAIMGGSYGGYMTLAALTMLPDRFAAGIDTVGMSNLVTFLERTGPWRRAQREAEYGSLATQRDLLREVSPITHLHDLQAPLMVIQGANDPRVPQHEADQIVEKLREKNHPVEYLLFPDEGHGVVKLANRMKSFTASAAFLDRYVKNRK